MENKQTLVKSVQWYFHPNESARILRYFQFNMQFDKTIDYTPIYSDDISVGIVITDIEDKKLLEKIKFENVLLYGNDLKDIAEKYKFDYYESPNLFKQDGIGNLHDINAILIGLYWAKTKNIDILIKCSLKEFTDNFNLIHLAKSTDGNTFCDVGKNCGINTSYLGLHVKSWSDNYPIQCMEFVIQNELVVLPEIWLHELAKTIAGNNHSEKWKTYLEINKIDYLHSGYVQWKI